MVMIILYDKNIVKDNFIPFNLSKLLIHIII